jgi:hypothetical protein
VQLVTALRIAIAREGILDKESMSYDDILDAMRLCVRGFETIQDYNAAGNSTDPWPDEQVDALTEEKEEAEPMVVVKEPEQDQDQQQAERSPWKSYRLSNLG